MTEKEIVQSYWRDFEILAFRAVKDELPQKLIFEEKLTQSIKDGGYDGEFILVSQDSADFHILFEAKLRSNPKADLPLNDFAKALVIAIVRQADMIYIVTNLHFSSQTMKSLESYAHNISLSIQLLNGVSMKQFIEAHRTLLTDIHMDLQNFLTSQKYAFGTQALPVPSTEQLISSQLTPQPEAKYTAQAKMFHRGKSVLCIEGHIGCGKSYHIENLCKALSFEKKPVFLIDLSKCQTYKELFLKIVEKTLGLSLELVDLVSTQSFVDAFSKVGHSRATKDDIQMLKFIFSRDTEYPYDYSILFSHITSFYAQIYPRSKKHSMVGAFLNLAYAQREVLQLLLYFLQQEDIFSSILEISSDDMNGIACHDWQLTRANLLRLSTFGPYTVEDWSQKDAQRFLQKRVKGITKDQMNALIRQFGCAPADLSCLVELIDYSKLYEETPKELVFKEITALKITKNDSLYQTCYQYMQYANSNSLYIYAFIVLLSGEVSRSALDIYFPSQVQAANIVFLIERSGLFVVDCKKVATRNVRTKECLQAYCEKFLPLSVMEPVYEFIKSHPELFHMTEETRLEMACRVNYYRDPRTYVESLAELGDRYLRLGQIQLSKQQYQKAYAVIEDSSPICLSTLVELQIRMGLVETLIWELGMANAELQEQLDFIESFSISALEENRTYQILILRYYCLRYQFHHAQDHHPQALDSAEQGVQWAETHNLYETAPKICGKIWRFYAIAVKEKTNDIKKCLDIFQKGYPKCHTSVQFLFGYIIHKNMAVDDADAQERVLRKLKNYELLLMQEKELSKDEYLHYRVNVAALHFLAKDYEEALRQYTPLLEESVIFNIVREEIRILNDMANLCWIHGELDEAQKKYCKGKELAKISGCVGNYWPILVNLLSFELSNGQYFQALELYQELEPYLKQVCSWLQVKGLSFEQREYYTAALYICLKNLLNLYQAHSNSGLLSAAEQLLNISGINAAGTDGNIEDTIRWLPLEGTLFDHNGLYLIKD